MTTDAQKIAAFDAIPVIAIECFTITARKAINGSAFVKVWDIDKNGQPFAQIGHFRPSQGGNFAVGFAKGNNGGRFNTYAEAEEFVRNF